MKLKVAAYVIPHSQNANLTYQPTILSSATLLQRLSIEVIFLLARLKTSWPAFKKDPLGFTRRIVAELLHARAADHRALATTAVIFCGV